MKTTTKFVDYAEQRRPHIERQLRTLLKVHRGFAAELSQEYQDLYGVITALLKRGGKRLRPLVYLLAYEGYGGTRHGAALQTALSHELLHAFLLIHDDVIDRDYFRWGGPNITGLYFEKYSRSMDARDALHLAESRAILAGDICMSLAQSSIVTSGFETAVITRLQQLQQRALFTVISGELTDVAQSWSKDMPTPQQVLQMYGEKTSSYTFSLPLISAAVSAGAHEDLSRLQDIGGHMGVAYQLQDDLLSMFADQADTGKSSGSDLQEGKRTVLLLKTIEMATTAQRQTLDNILQQTHRQAEDVLAVRQIMVDSGAKEFVEMQAKQYADKAIQAIAETALNQNAKACLIDLIEQLSVSTYIDKHAKVAYNQ